MSKLCENCAVEHCADRNRGQVVFCSSHTAKPIQTHADHIRAMSDEELAEFIRDVSYECQDAYCGHHCSMCAYPWCSSKRTMNWLKQPAEVSGDA